ncbi:MAG: 6-methylsalicylate decarboxylase [Solirubrobacteraceae bacterium]|jgi:hypothetical protein|nr:6-methylsalicylate decarboxylase [Solirubrobacteraceae bacterium]
MDAVDAHQHLWPEAVLRCLERRNEPPCAMWDGAVWHVSLAGEPAFAVDPADHDPFARAAAVRDDGLDRALVALSTPVGIEALPAGEAETILAAWAAAGRALPQELQAWGSVALDLSPAELGFATHDALDAGAAGVVIPAGALAGRGGLDRIAPVLDVLERRLAPAFIHPGPAPWTRPAATVPEGWWAPVTRYVSELHTAWHTWSAWGRDQHPSLRTVWAALAGLAPLHAERSALRDGPDADLPDPLAFFDTSGYGPRAVRSVACAVGRSQLVHGTDRPVVRRDPLAGEPLGLETHAAMRTDNVARALGTAWVVA